MGAEAVRELLHAIDLEHEIGRLREDSANQLGNQDQEASKRLKLMEAFQGSGNLPSGWS
jgi:DNA-directed RNA polymerase subunit beta'